jgi:hypothetical protein
MNTKRTTAILCMTGLVVFCFAAGHLGSNNVSAQNGDGTWSCNVAGTYVHTSPSFDPEGNAAVIVTTLVPLDPMGTRLKMVERWTNSDSSLGGMFPEADMESPLFGEAVKVGHDTYKFSIMGYAFKKLQGDRGELQYISATAGSLRIIDCDTIEIFDVYLMLYGAEQDKDGDGFADSDEKPNICHGPFPGEARKRVPLMEPCVP